MYGGIFVVKIGKEICYIYNVSVRGRKFFYRRCI